MLQYTETQLHRVAQQALLVGEQRADGIALAKRVPARVAFVTEHGKIGGTRGDEWGWLVFVGGGPHAASS